jgi:hypothetical protein
MLPVCLRARVSQSQLLRFVADSQYRAIVGLWLRYPVIAHMDRINDVAHAREGAVFGGLDAVVLVETGWYLTGRGEFGVWNSFDVYRLYYDQNLP